MQHARQSGVHMGFTCGRSITLPKSPHLTASAVRPALQYRPLGWPTVGDRQQAAAPALHRLPPRRDTQQIHRCATH